VTDEVVVNGVKVGPHTNLPLLLKRQLLDGSILGSRYDESPEPGIWSLFEASKGTSLEHRLVNAIKDLLTDPDSRIRAGAVGLVQAYSEKFRGPELLAVLERNDALFGVPAGAGRSEPSLAWGLLRAIAGSSSWDDDVLRRLRSAALEFPEGLNVLAGLTTHDPEWVIDHAQELIGNELGRAKVILFRLKDPLARQRLILSVPIESPLLRSVLANAVRDEVESPDERQRLLQLLSDD
jgi:hypothetical protein